MPASNVPSTPSPEWAWKALPPGAKAETLARAWLGDRLGCADPDLPILRDARGRPRLAAPFGTHDCNWSHSGKGLLLVLGRDLQVGADLEWLRPRPRALDLARRYFAPAEADWIAGLEAADRERGFLRLWCAKEALLKAHGHGLSFGLHRVHLEEHAGQLRLEACDAALGRPGEWSLLEIEPAPGYIGALAWRAAER